MTENGANIQKVKSNISVVSQKTEEIGTKIEQVQTDVGANGAKIEQVQTGVGANGAKIKQVQTQVDEMINIIHYININDTIIITKGD